MLKNLPGITLLEMDRTRIVAQVPLTPELGHNSGILSISPNPILAMKVAGQVALHWSVGQAIHLDFLGPHC